MSTTAVSIIGSHSLAAMDEQEIIAVLQSSLYPGASVPSIKMVLGYCKASGLDPMQKPVHIVPMSVKTGKKDGNGWDIKEMRDVVMPGIGLYRTQAARSGLFAGVTEPEFGPDVTEPLGSASVTYPAWCKVTVKRLLGTQIAEFSACERWKENYATASNKTAEPNAMWKRRPYAQLAKCAEAQALRRAFPEFGSAPTADEMEGKEFSGEVEINPMPAPARRQTGKQAAEAAKQQADAEVDADARAELVAKLQKIAEEEGEVAYADAFADIGKGGRLTVGADEHKRLRAIAAETTRAMRELDAKLVAEDAQEGGDDE
jgi:phage recombination protein Bet